MSNRVDECPNFSHKLLTIPIENESLLEKNNISQSNNLYDKLHHYVLSLSQMRLWGYPVPTEPIINSDSKQDNNNEPVDDTENRENENIRKKMRLEGIAGLLTGSLPNLQQSESLILQLPRVVVSAPHRYKNKNSTNSDELQVEEVSLTYLSTISKSSSYFHLLPLCSHGDVSIVSLDCGNYNNN